ncbi:MAG: hypothetical protein U0M22_09310 [Acutalibacteraceae bacterium]|nr:hypothetical protein [Acutalibacteraceae bacterium]
MKKRISVDLIVRYFPALVYRKFAVFCRNLRNTAFGDFGLCPARMQADKKKVFYTAAFSAYNLKGDRK